MLFSTIIFIFFFLPGVLFFYYIIFKNHRRAQNIFLFFASLFFYAWGEPWFVFVMILSIIANWRFGLIVGKRRQQGMGCKWPMVGMLVFNLGILFVFKYLVFTLKSINLFFHSDLSVPAITLPIGISFFTFQAISYVIDISRGKGEVQQNLLLVGLYIAFFPQLVAGPIIRYETVAGQINNRKETFESFKTGIGRFIIGLSKKVLLANSMGIVADKAFNMPTGDLSLSFAWLGILAFTFQVFFDFSGYSDMAIGMAKMFGFHFPGNFNDPFISKTISEFWQRWHISLGQWFRDYVYFPMGGSRVSRPRLYLNLFIVWFLTGMWHGANWTFFVWGLYYLAILSVERMTNLKKRASRFDFLKPLYVFLLFNFGNVLFRSYSLAQARDYAEILLGFSGNPLADINTTIYICEYGFIYLLSIIFSVNISKAIPQSVRQNSITAAFYHLGLLLLFLVAVSYVIKGAYNPFIYFNF